MIQNSATGKEFSNAGLFRNKTCNFANLLWLTPRFSLSFLAGRVTQKNMGFMAPFYLNVKVNWSGETTFFSLKTFHTCLVRLLHAMVKTIFRSSFPTANALVLWVHHTIYKGWLVAGPVWFHEGLRCLILPDHQPLKEWLSSFSTWDA
jgi:hypothetical protein